MATTAKPAAKNAAKDSEKPAAAPAPVFAVEEVTDADALKTTRTSKPNPLLDALRTSLESDKVLQVPVSSLEQADEAQNLLRRASKTLGCGLSMKATATHIVFKGKKDKRERKYTATQIREWARKEGATEDMLTPRIAREVRLAFRKAHGLTKDDAEK